MAHWLSTGPGCTGLGHWMSNLRFLDRDIQCAGQSGEHAQSCPSAIALTEGALPGHTLGSIHHECRIKTFENLAFCDRMQKRRNTGAICCCSGASFKLAAAPSVCGHTNDPLVFRHDSTNDPSSIGLGRGPSMSVRANGPTLTQGCSASRTLRRSQCCTPKGLCSCFGFWGLIASCAGYQWLGLWPTNGTRWLSCSGKG